MISTFSCVLLDSTTRYCFSGSKRRLGGEDSNASLLSGVSVYCYPVPSGNVTLGHEYTVKFLVITTLSSLLLDDTVVTHVISIGNWSLGDESVVRNDERVVN